MKRKHVVRRSLFGLALTPALLAMLGWSNLPSASPVETKAPRSGFVAVADVTHHNSGGLTSIRVQRRMNLWAKAGSGSDAGRTNPSGGSTGQQQGVRILTEPGIRRTTAEIMAQHPPQRPANFDKLRNEFELEGPDREHLPGAPGAVQASQWPPPDPTKPRPDRPTSAPQTLSTQFDGATGPTETGYILPDTEGSVGPTQFFVFINGRMRTFNKTTGVADGVINADPDVFFSSVMSTPDSGEVVFTLDPNV